MEKQYKKYEEEANKNWNLEAFGLPPKTQISFRDFPGNIRLVYSFNEDLVIEAYYELGWYSDETKLSKLFKPEVVWDVGLWSITDEPWLEDSVAFKDLGKCFATMYKHAESLSPKEVKAADKKYRNIGKRPIKKFDVSYAL